MKEEYYTLNTFKFFSMLCVIGIHTSVYLTGVDVIHFLLDSIYRVGVPFFFITTGYLTISKIKNSGFIYIKAYI